MVPSLGDIKSKMDYYFILKLGKQRAEGDKWPALAHRVLKLEANSSDFCPSMCLYTIFLMVALFSQETL